MRGSWCWMTGRASGTRGAPDGIRSRCSPRPSTTACPAWLSGAPDTYPDKDQVADYLEAYAAAFDLPVRLNSRVTRLRRDRRALPVRTAGQTFSARQVVVATGPFAQPFVPSLADRLDPRRHPAAQLAVPQPAHLPDGPIWSSAPETPVCRSPRSWSPPARGSVGRRQPDGVAAAVAGPGPVLVADHSDCWRRRLVTARPSDALPRRIRHRHQPATAATRRGRPPRLGWPTRTARLSVRRRHQLEVSGVIWATGFRADHSWLRIPGVHRDGRLVHQRGATDVPGLYFLGLPWQHTRGSALLGFVAADAAHLAERLAAVRRAPAPPAETGRRSGLTHR